MMEGGERSVVGFVMELVRSPRSLQTSQNVIRPEIVFDTNRYERRGNRRKEGIWKVDERLGHTGDRHLVCQQSVNG